MKTARVLLLLLGVLPLLTGAEEGALTYDRALALALQHSKAAQLARLKAEEADAAVRLARNQRYPRVNVIGLAGYVAQPLDVKLKAGSLTSLLDEVGAGVGLGALSPSLGRFPATDLTLLRGENHQYLAGISVFQPLTQQWRIGSGLAAAQAAAVATRREADRANLQIGSAVEQFFAGALLAQTRGQAQAARSTWLAGRLRDAENARSVGEVLDDAVLGLRAELTQSRAEEVRRTQEHTRLLLQLADLIGRPGDRDLLLAGGLPEREAYTLDFWLARAEWNPDRVVAAAMADQARAGERAARQARIPDLTLFASGYWQEGQALVPARGGVAGVAFNWEIWDFGRRSAEASRGRIQLRLAETNRDRLEEEAMRQIREAWQDVEYAGQLIRLTDEARAYRQRLAELARQNTEQGLELGTKVLETRSDLLQAEADWQGACLQRHLALLRLYTLTGLLTETAGGT